MGCAAGHHQALGRLRAAPLWRRRRPPCLRLRRAHRHARAPRVCTEISMGGDAAAATAPEPGRRILVAVDEGDESVQVLRWCLGTFAAAARGDTFILLYVRPAPPTYSVLDASGYLFAEEVTAAIDRYSREVADAVVEKAQKLCTLYSKEGESDLEMMVEVKVAVGDARTVICQMADKLGPTSWSWGVMATASSRGLCLGVSVITASGTRAAPSSS